MARQVGPVFATGTIDGIVFYKLGEHYYMRSKGDYKCAKMMRKDPRLKRTMQKADQFGEASRIVKGVYYQYLPKVVRKYGLFGQLTGLVNGWLQQGMSIADAEAALLVHFQTLIPAKATVRMPPDVPRTATEGEAQATPVKTTIPIVQPPATPSLKEVEAKLAVAKSPVMKPPVVKQARYLSNWKVKRNGRLHIPRPVATNYQPAPELDPELVEGRLAWQAIRPFSKRNE